MPTRKTPNSAGIRICTLREAAGMSREQVAEEAGVDLSFLSRLERGRVGIGLDCAARLADAIGCGVDDFLSKSAPSRKQTRLRRLVRVAARLDDGDLEVAEVLVATLSARKRTVSRNTAGR